MEENTALALLGSAIASAKVIQKLLGPTADYIGEGLRSFTERRIENIRRIFANSVDKLGTRIEDEGGVPPRVLQLILSDGSFNDDPIAIDYLGGVLASARSPVGRDDRGSAFASMITRLSSYQLRAHYLIYSSIKRNVDGKPFDVGDDIARMSAQALFHFWDFCEAMEFQPPEDPDTLISHALFGLAREQLIQSFFFGYGKEARQYGDLTLETNKRYIQVRPSALGVELLMWAYGMGSLNLAKFSSSDVTFPDLPGLKRPKNIWR